MKRYFLILFLLFCGFQMCFAQDFYTINISDSVIINEFGICHKVSNYGLYNLFVPTSSFLEWSLFTQNYPFGIQLSECNYWNISTEWSNCSEVCGGGLLTRTVDCVSANGTIVDDSLCEEIKPIESKECNTMDCEYATWGRYRKCSCPSSSTWTLTSSSYPSFNSTWDCYITSLYDWTNGYHNVYIGEDDLWKIWLKDRCSDSKCQYAYGKCKRPIE